MRIPEIPAMQLLDPESSKQEKSLEKIFIVRKGRLSTLEGESESKKVGCGIILFTGRWQGLEAELLATLNW